ncbi:MAG: 8-oxoguanine DNA glycosylase [Clostridiales bacterium]|jgi:putative DNA glycosylase (DNA repair protein)|nr:8-oxoguanine DNA glycosylase [Clostridiales bacterium]
MEKINYKIKANSFELADIFDCGQCFRWNIEDDGSYTGVFKKIVLNVKKIDDEVFFNGVNYGNTDSIEEINHYFDLNRNYDELKSKLEKIDDYMKNSIEFGKGIRILNQDLWETIISFIISANNNIPRIKGIIDRLSEKYGEKLEYDGRKYYSFPEPIALKDVSVSEYRSLGLGFRDIRLYETTQKILNNEFDLNGQWNLDTGTVYKNLLELSGVGPKVADCILLFSDLKRFDVFPIDVWIRRVMNDLYIHNDDETKVSKVQIQKLADEKFGSLKGLAQQYLFYWRRSL